MVSLNVVIQVCGLFVTVRAPLLHKSCSQVHLGYVKLQIEVAVSGIRALTTEFVLHALMYPLHVLSHLVSAAELLGTVHTWNLFPLRWASTIRPSQMIFQIFENLATKFTVFQCFLCVSSFEVLSHFHRNICFVIAHGTLHWLIVIVNPVNVEVQGCFGGKGHSTVGTRHILLVLRFDMIVKRGFCELGLSTK